MLKKTTIYDISAKLKVSPATVSRALNNNPGVGPKTKERVLLMAAEMNYSQNLLAQSLRNGKSRNVGVIVPLINHGLFPSVIRGIEEQLFPLGYNVIICQTNEEVEKEAKHIKNLLNNQVDGIFISVTKATQKIDHLLEVVQKGIPLIFFDRKKEVPNVSSVILDDFQAGFMATEHLIKEDWKQIAHITGDQNLEIYRERLKGYMAALDKYNIDCNQDWIISTESDILGGRKAIERLWSLDNRPDAIFSANDYAALGALQELKARNLKVPDQVGIVGFSNELFTAHTEIPISSIHQSPLLMGRNVAQLFLEQTAGSGKNMSGPRSIIIEPELVVRKSSLKREVQEYKSEMEPIA